MLNPGSCPALGLPPPPRAATAALPCAWVNRLAGRAWPACPGPTTPSVTAPPETTAAPDSSGEKKAALIRVPNATLRITLPAGLRLLSGGIEWRGDLAAGQEIILGAKVEATAPWQWMVRGETNSDTPDRLPFGPPPRTPFYALLAMCHLGARGAGDGRVPGTSSRLPGRSGSADPPGLSHRIARAPGSLRRPVATRKQSATAMGATTRNFRPMSKRMPLSARASSTITGMCTTKTP